MEFFRQNTNINFMEQRRFATIFSGILFLLAVISLQINGLAWGLDFTGGTQIELHFPTSPNIPQIRESMHNAGFKEAVVITYGTSLDVLISVMPQHEATVSTTALAEDLNVKIK